MECHENTSRKKNNALKSVAVVLVVVEKSLARLFVSTYPLPTCINSLPVTH
jgi:hypothetical protein